MCQPQYEVADIIARFGESFQKKFKLNTYQLRTLEALRKCRTSALGGHKLRCNNCGKEHISYNSCRNRHCPKCQGLDQLSWANERIKSCYKVKHYHIVFTLPEVLNPVCLNNSKWFYNHMFTCIWEVLKSFGYSHFASETGAICVLHTWGENLSFHPHIHCIFPAIGFSLKGKMKYIGKNGKYLFPVTQLSLAFKGKFLKGVKRYLKKHDIVNQYSCNLQDAWRKKWVVYCQPAFGKPDHVIQYLSRYIHRVAISNHRIIKITDKQVCFSMKDYRQNGKSAILWLPGEEFLRRFCMHILPAGFVKIRYFGIYSSRFRSTIKNTEKIIITAPVNASDEVSQLLKFDIYQCPFCKKGKLIVVEVIPKARSPALFYWPVKSSCND